LGAAGLAHAQFDNPDPRDINQAKMKALLVPLVEETTRTLIDLQSKPDELKRYKDGIARFNEMLKRSVDNNWKMSNKPVEYMPQSDVDKLVKAGNNKYMIFQYDLREGALQPLMFGKIYGDDTYDSDIRKISKDAGYGVFKVGLVGPSKTLENFYTIFLPVAYPSEGDMVYAVKMMQAQFTHALKDRTYQVSEFDNDVKANNKVLKNRTLLIDKYQLDGKTIAEDVKKVYDNNFEIVDYSAINTALINGDTNYAVIQIVPMSMPTDKVQRTNVSYRIMHVVVDAGNERVLAASKPTRMNYDKIADDISKKEIKDYTL
jgi:hypothetical protein